MTPELLKVRTPFIDFSISGAHRVSLIRELETRLGSYVDVVYSSSGDATVSIEVLDCEGPLPPETADSVQLRNHVEFPRFQRSALTWRHADHRAVYDGELGVTTCVRPSRARVRGTRGAAVATAVRRMIQDLMRIAIFRSGGVILEASCAVFTGGRGCVFVGPSGSGKSTALAQVLSLGAKFVGNDDVALFARPTGVIAYGLPTQVRVRPALTTMFPNLLNLAGDVMPGRDPKILCLPESFASSFGTSVVGHCADPRLVLLPARGEAVVSPVQHLVENVVTGPSWQTPWRDVLVGSPRASEVEARIVTLVNGCDISRGVPRDDPRDWLPMFGEHRAH